MPATTWLPSEGPGTPLVSAKRGRDGVQLRLKAGQANMLYAVWARHGGEWRFSVAPAVRVDWTVPDDAKLGAADLVVVSAVDRLGNEGARVQAWRRPA